MERSVDQEVSLIWIASAILRRRRLIVGLVTVAVLLVWAVILSAPRSYTARFSFQPQMTDNSATGVARVAAQLGLDIPRSGAQTGPRFFVYLLRSRFILAQVIHSGYLTGPEGDSVSLLTLLDVGPADSAVMLTRGIDRLRERVTATSDAETGIVNGEVRMDDPLLAAQIAERLLAAIEQFNIRTRQSQATAERRFAEARMQEAQHELLEAEDSMARFLQRNREFRGSPSLAFDHDRLRRSIDIRQAVLASLAQSFEQARIAEVRDTPVLTLMLPPSPPAIPDRRYLIVRTMMVVVVGGLFTVFLAVIVELASGGRAAEPDEYRRFTELWRESVGDLRRLLMPWRARRTGSGG